MTLYDNTLASHSYRFKRLMLAYADTEIEQLLRNSRLLFEKLDKVLDAPNKATETYRLEIEELVEVYQTQGNIKMLQAKLQRQYLELQKLV